MENLERKALAYAALQRFWVFDEPASAEQKWRNELAFAALSKEQQAPGHWYQYEGEQGYIEYKSTGDDGEFHVALPPEVDPASVIVVPALHGVPSIYDHMRGLLLETAGQPGETAAQRMVEDLDELRGPNHAKRIRLEISEGGFAAVIAGKDAISGFLTDTFKKRSTEHLNRSQITGFEVSSLALLDSLARQLNAASPTPPPNLIGKMFDPFGVPSLPEMTARFIHDCLQAGMAGAVDAAIDDIRKGGDATLKAARELPLTNMHPGLYMDSYYTALQQAGIRFGAVRWGSLSALTFAQLSEAERSRYEKRAASAEEKFVRVGFALLYAIQDLDGSRYREKQQALRAATAAGDEQKARALLFNVFESQMLYPKAVQERFCQAAAAAS